MQSWRNLKRIATYVGRFVPYEATASDIPTFTIKMWPHLQKERAMQRGWCPGVERLAVQIDKYRDAIWRFS